MWFSGTCFTKHDISLGLCAIFALRSASDLNIEMVELIPLRFQSWVVEGWRNMADLADKIDDMICTFEGEGDTTMDTVAMYMFGWMMFGLVVLGIGKFVYGNFVINKDLKTQNAAEPPITVTKTENSVVDAVVKQSQKETITKSSSGGGKYVPPTPPSRKRLGSRSGKPVVGPVKQKTTTLVHPPPLATGAESESVKWVNELLYWLYSDQVIINELLNVWIQTLNDYTKKSVDEVGLYLSTSKHLYVSCHKPNSFIQ